MVAGGHRTSGELGVRTALAQQDVRDEMAAARRVFSRGGFAVVDMTHKSIEDGANEVISLVTHSLV